MCITTGIDIVSVSRVRKILREKKSLFLKKLFSPAEIEYCEKKIDNAPYYAARFAAKEAFIKAFPDKSIIFAYSDIEVKKKGDLPCIELKNGLSCLLNDFEISLSIAHEKEYAVASVVILKR